MWWWVLVTFVFITAAQASIPLFVVFSEDLAGTMEWGFFIGHILGLAAVPMVLGCLGLFFRRNRGVAYFVVSLVAFGIMTFGDLAA